MQLRTVQQRAGIVQQPAATMRKCSSAPQLAGRELTIQRGNSKGPSGRAGVSNRRGGGGGSNTSANSSAASLAALSQVWPSCWCPVVSPSPAESLW